ncbi:hypothetical protein [uncultured Pseudodesulfovibrio sp.]|uniref:hypothetical protein n=1 Tax=uncultured Pseudodesulfovibrio sp. TaxID=2035858 RepID=UPI0029C9514C|nr:hypothetical protein [uncultured Pseudodesulfovibrio sp.]
MNERAKYRGLLAEAEDNENHLKVKLTGLVESLRDHLEPFTDPGSLNGEIIASQATDFASVQIELKSTRARISAIKNHLGME